VRRFQLTLLVLASLAATAQIPGEMPFPVDRDVDFTRDVHPILAEKCFQCHGAGKSRGGLSMHSRAALLDGGESGPAVVEGNSAESYIIRLVVGLPDGLRMPPSGPSLADAEIGILRAWIDQGLEWSLEAAATSLTLPLAPRRPELPEIEHLSHPVDRLMQPFYEQQGITAAEPVDDVSFLRRVYFDVIGLPPTPEQVEAFLADTEPEKRRNVVRSLLRDNQGYAEHWMTFWNDSLRNDYQGTGYIDGGRKQITAWLYNALYENLPYQQMVTQLISPTPASEGFINGIQWRGDANASQMPHMQAAQTVSQVFLGVNLKCASCHDSFVNQWTLADAYGMASVFTEEPPELVRCDVPTGQIATPQFLWPELGAISPDISTKGRKAELARLVTHPENGRFTRTIANRLWGVFFGKALIEPIEDLDSNPWNVDLLDWLATDFADHGYDLRHLIEVILTSQTYQLAADRAYDPDVPYLFRGPLPRRLTAEQFSDAVSMITEVWQPEPKFDLPSSDEARAQKVRAWRVVSDPMTRALGRPNREMVTLRREATPTTLQALELTNGETYAALVGQGGETLASTSETDAEQLVNRIYRRALLRMPTDSERAVAVATIGSPATVAGVADLLWLVTMTPEFQYIW
jgi:hypothetical protein